MLNGKSILITGGTGSFGRKFLLTILERYPDIKRIVIFSRDELKQYEMSQRFPKSRFPFIRFFIGDIRDRERIYRALERVDTVIHTAAMKQVPAAEYNPFECIKTNVIGAQNLIEACLDSDVEKVVALSTDKAAAPINLYGATKLCSDKLFTAVNHFKGSRSIKFSVVRYGNVLGSRGSVLPLFLRMKKKGHLTITDQRMTRFIITLDQAVEMVLTALEVMWGGEIFVPKIPSTGIMDLAEAVAPGCGHEFIGIRAGEKLHEEMITQTDSLNAIDCGPYYVILPTLANWDVKSYVSNLNATPCDSEFRYSSDTNDQWLSVDTLRRIVAAYDINDGT